MTEIVEVNEVVEVADTVVPPEVEQEPVSLALNDLIMVVNVIDLCSKRGAFEGTELEAVGGLRGRLVTFIKANQPPAEAPAEAEAEAPVTE